jgi:uncharacterized FlaG/YvyC family protein
MDTTAPVATLIARAETAARTNPRPSGSTSQAPEKKKNAAPEPKPKDFGVTVKGRFDADLRRYFVTISDTSSGSLIFQFPSRAAAQYAQQIANAAGKPEPDPNQSERAGKPEDRLDQRT